MQRLNITLPTEIVKELKAFPNKSRFIAMAVKERLEQEKRQKLDQLLVEGYQATRKEDESLNREWEKATLKDWS